MHKDKYGQTPLKALIENYAGYLMEYEADLGNIGHFDEERLERMIEMLSLLVSKYLELQISGEFAFGGIFNSDEEGKFTSEENIFDPNEDIEHFMHSNWDKLFIQLFRPALQQVMALPQHRQQPILQAAIINKAHPHIIKDIVNHFTDSINTVDSLGRYPIDVAVQQSLSLDDGLREIIMASASAQQSTPIIMCALHGLVWENGMRQAFEDIDENEVERKDEKTGLYLFMLAAVGGRHNYDLGSVYCLIQASPGCLISMFDGANNMRKK